MRIQSLGGLLVVLGWSMVLFRDSFGFRISRDEFIRGIRQLQSFLESVFGQGDFGIRIVLGIGESISGFLFAELIGLLLRGC